MSAAKKTRPTRAAAPALPPMEMLERTHAQVMVTLERFSMLLARLESHGVDELARDMAADICSFFAKEARQHHADEDVHVFPTLLASGDAQLVQHVERLQQDHGWLEEDWIELGPQLDALSRGYSWYDLDALRSAVEVFTQLYHEHIALEESLIYPEARRRMAEAAAQTEARMAAV